MSDSRWVYDSRMSLQCCEYPGLHRQIGILASRPAYHEGLGTECVDIHRETVSVTTKGYGGVYPAASSTEQIIRATQHTITDLDAVISELTEHRDRLRTTIEGGAAS